VDLILVTSAEKERRILEIIDVPIRRMAVNE